MGLQAELLQALQKAQGVADDRLKKNPRDKEALYWGGVTHATRSEFLFTLQRSNLAALREGLEARKYHLKLYKSDPHYADALLVIGIADYVAGSLPWYVKVLASMSGIHGSRAQGVEELKRVSQEGYFARVDARICSSRTRATCWACSKRVASMRRRTTGRRQSEFIARWLKSLIGMRPTMS